MFHKSIIFTENQHNSFVQEYAYFLFYSVICGDSNLTIINEQFEPLKLLGKARYRDACIRNPDSAEFSSLIITLLMVQPTIIKHLLKLHGNENRTCDEFIVLHKWCVVSSKNMI